MRKWGDFEIIGTYYQTIHTCIKVSIHPSIHPCPPTINLLSMYPSIHLSIHPSIYLFIYLSIHPYIYLCIISLTSSLALNQNDSSPICSWKTCFFPAMSSTRDDDCQPMTAEVILHNTYLASGTHSICLLCNELCGDDYYFYCYRR